MILEEISKILDEFKPKRKQDSVAIMAIKEAISAIRNGGWGIGAILVDNQSGKIICVGFFGMMLAQIVINIGMCVALLPVIGVTLPFFSAGGTSLICMYLGVGLVLSVYKHRNTRTLYLRDK